MQTTENILIRTIRSEIECRRQIPSTRDFNGYLCPSHLAIEWGKEYEPQELPNKYPKGVPQYCFSNSFKAAREYGLVYVEGFAALDDLPLPIHHAWCVEPGSNKVIDVTTTKIAYYVGIPFKLSALKKHTTKDNMSILDQWEKRFPLLHMSDQEIYKLIDRRGHLPGTEFARTKF